MTGISRRALLAAGAGMLMTRPLFAVGADGKPKRIVTIGSDVTEIVYALGAGASVVGRDSSSISPADAKALPDLGYFRSVGAEGILSLNPTMVIASASAGPPEALNHVAATGVPVVRMPDRFTAEVLLEKLRIAAEALGVVESGQALSARLQQALQAAQAEVQAMPGQPRALFLLSARGGAPMAAGKDTAADGMISLARATNVFADHSGYKPISLEATAAAAPEAIILMDHTLTAMGGIDGVLDHPALKLTPAARNRRIIAREGPYLLGFGPRLPDAIKDLAIAVRNGAA